MKEKKILYDHNQDKKEINKWTTNKTLTKIETHSLPNISSRSLI